MGCGSVQKTIEIMPPGGFEQKQSVQTDQIVQTPNDNYKAVDKVSQEQSKTTADQINIEQLNQIMHVMIQQLQNNDTMIHPQLNQTANQNFCQIVTIVLPRFPDLVRFLQLHLSNPLDVNIARQLNEHVKVLNWFIIDRADANTLQICQVQCTAQTFGQIKDQLSDYKTCDNVMTKILAKQYANACIDNMKQLNSATALDLVAAVIVDAAFENCVICRNPQFPKQPQNLTFPKGAVQYEEPLKAAVLREVFEETGIVCHQSHIKSVVEGEKQNTNLSIFLIVVPDLLERELKAICANEIDAVLLCKIQQLQQWKAPKDGIATYNQKLELVGEYCFTKFWNDAVPLINLMLNQYRQQQQ